MVVRPKKNKRNIDNFDVWLTAWNNYEALLVQNHPDIYPNLSVFRQLIQNFRCKSYEHVVSSCPFPSEYQMEANKTSKDIQKEFEKWFHNGNEGCNNYHFGKCTFSNCSRAHVCKECRGPDPGSRYAGSR